MTPWGPLLKDEQIAAVLNHELTSWGNDALVTDFTPITPEEVAALRANNLTSQQVYELRGTLGLE
jgi:cytochrome c oxidase cbb3-type subunit II